MKRADLAAIPSQMVGTGSAILDAYVKPLLAAAGRYDRVTSYYNPYSIINLLEQLGRFWSHHGRVRLIIGYHEAYRIIPVLNLVGNVEKCFVDAVSLALAGDVGKLKKLVIDKEKMIPVLAEIIDKGAIEVRLVAPRTSFDYYQIYHHWPREDSIFHPKFAIFDNLDLEDSGQPTTAVLQGSFNETLHGYGDNVEDISLFGSWNPDNAPHVEYFKNKFEEMWQDRCSYVKVMPFTDSFREICKHVSIEYKNDKKSWFSFNTFKNLIKESQIYHSLSFEQVRLLPHQLRVHKLTLSRWPVRAILADDVGLGKTIEAGACIHYMINHAFVQNVLVLVPASLRYQWQSELKTLFEMDFYVYEPSTGELVMGEERIYVGKNPFYSPISRRIIVSWHWLREQDKKGTFKITNPERYQLLIVDEAHAARKHEDREKITTTQLYDLLSLLGRTIPHILLLTATPIQTAYLDYFSLLEIIGIPDYFKSVHLNRFSAWYRGSIDASSLSFMMDQIVEYRHCQEYYRLRTEGHLKEISLLDESLIKNSPFEVFEKVKPLTRQDYIACHPTTLTTIRNTRKALKEQGYRFPSVNLEGIEVKVNESQKKYLESIKDYIDGHLCLPERAILGNANALGMIKSLYHQRLASSLQAARDTLQRRKSLLRDVQDYSQSKKLFDYVTKEFGEELNEEAVRFIQKAKNKDQIRIVIQEAETEILHIEKVLSLLDKTFLTDPKIESLKNIIDEHLSMERQIIIFSRFTSTTDSIYKELIRDYLPYGIGRYEGGLIAKHTLDGMHRLNKQMLIQAFRTKEFRLMICTDAASEGLNLQVANVLINVDVPWNPARLMQRFGRIDRFGQKADNVYLYNLYYPDSIESRMYSVLHGRNVDVQTVLGETQEIMSEAHKRYVREIGNGERAKLSITKEEVDKARQQIEKKQFLSTVISVDSKGGLQDLLFECILKGAKRKAYRIVQISDKCYQLKIKEEVYSFSLDPTDEEFLDLNNRILDALIKNYPKNDGVTLPIISVVTNSNKVLIPALLEGDDVLPITFSRWKDLLNYFISGEPVDITGWTRFNQYDLDPLLEFLVEEERNIWPNPKNMGFKGFQDMRPEELMIKIGTNLGDIAVNGS